jgi:hypothetical protein
MFPQKTLETIELLFWLSQEHDNQAVGSARFFIKSQNRQKDSSLLDLVAMYYVKDE